jgi:glutathione S-transferase
MEPHPPAVYKPYTLPAVTFCDGTHTMDSKKIVERLERDYPSPPLYHDDPMVARVDAHINKIVMPLLGELLPKSARNLLNPSSAEYFERTRAEMLKMSLRELEKSKGGEKAWHAARLPIEEMAKLLAENEGKYFLGDKRKHRNQTN